MRLSRFFAPRIATCAVSFVLAFAAGGARPLEAAEQGQSWTATVTGSAPATKAVAADARAIRSALTLDDQAAALEAVQFALDQVGDGATYVWHRKEGDLHGSVHPTASFLDAKGKVCRHIVMTLTVADFTKGVEGIACRDDARRWALEG